MARYQTWGDLPEHLRPSYKRLDEVMELQSSRPVAVADDDWECDHWIWLGFEDPLGIGCGCQDCAELIYEALLACRRQHGYAELP